jgi:tetratricopeptide (TPR) repeat protein
VELYHDYHPMGRSFAAVSTASPVEPYNKSNQSFVRGAGHFEIRRAGNTITHKEIYRVADQVSSIEAPIDYAMGSGNQGRSYLSNRDGWLFQSPISWYSHKTARLSPLYWLWPKPPWDLSPGYENNLAHFNRPIVNSCVFCHCDLVTPVEHTLSRYKQPLFPRQQAIGCERCHGPGELHVASRRRGDKPRVDFTIVNPARLKPALREAICQQCHLQGEARIERRGKSMFDFRPGLPLHNFLSVFVKPPQLSNSTKAVSHTEQMHFSRCFQETRGSANQLGCTSCHNPHRVPPLQNRVGHYRQQCLKCHQETSCHLTPAVRRKQQADDSCIACHMPPAKSSNIVHAAVTDHRILRRPDSPPQRQPEFQWAGIGLMHFHRDLVDPKFEGLTRDLALAMIEKAVESEPNMNEVALISRHALPFLNDAVEEHEDDVPAMEAQAYALWHLKELDEALQVLKRLLAKAPRRERALQLAVQITTALGDAEEAQVYGQQLLKLNPWHPNYHTYMANVYTLRGQWDEAVKECLECLRINPTSMATRQILIECWLSLGDKKKALLEFKRLLDIVPPVARNSLEEWFDQQSSK